MSQSPHQKSSGSPSPRDTGLALERQTNFQDRSVAYQSFAVRDAYVGVTVNNQYFTSTSALRQYLDSIDSESEIRVFRTIQDQIQHGTESLQEIASDVWGLAQTRQALQARRVQNVDAFTSEFQALAYHAEECRARRQREAEAHRRLTFDWMTEGFLRTVVLEQTNGSTAVLDALNLARTFGITPVQLMRQASALRLQRLAKLGPYQGYATNDLAITPQDIRFAISDPPHPTPVHLPREIEAATRHRLIADSQGVHWINGVPPAAIEAAYQNGGAITNLRLSESTTLGSPSA